MSDMPNVGSLVQLLFMSAFCFQRNYGELRKRQSLDADDAIDHFGWHDSQQFLYGHLRSPRSEHVRLVDDPYSVGDAIDWDEVPKFRYTIIAVLIHVESQRNLAAVKLVLLSDVAVPLDKCFQTP